MNERVHIFIYFLHFVLHPIWFDKTWQRPAFVFLSFNSFSSRGENEKVREYCVLLLQNCVFIMVGGGTALCGSGIVQRLHKNDCLLDFRPTILSFAPARCHHFHERQLKNYPILLMKPEREERVARIKL